MEIWAVIHHSKGRYSVQTNHGKPIASGITDEGIAWLISQLPELKELRYDWASVINRLAHLALDGCNSNDRDYAEDMLTMVRPYLPGYEPDAEGVVDQWMSDEQ